MKLKSAQIQNFRSVEDSGPFNIEQVTCLVGKNEAGKSAILQCLAALNPHPATPATLERERDYPRRFLTQYGQRHPTEAPIAVSTGWELSEEEQAKVKAEFGDGVLRSTDVRILRRYGTNGPEWEVQVDHRKVFEFLFATHGLDEGEQRPLTTANTKGLIEALSALSAPTEKQRALLAQLQVYGSVTKKIVEILSQSLPRFMYFSYYDRMDGAIQIDHLRQIAAQSKIGDDEHKGLLLFQEFLNYAGVPLDEILNVNTYETFNAKLQAASNNITDQILEYWTQNPDLSVEVRIEQAKQGDPAPFNTGTIARARIYNHLHRVDTPFSERSAGFIWFFSFLVKFAQVKNDSVPVILLLDEPGLSLHGKAQGDLLRYFDEKLAPHHQIMYSTHSPFMVAANKITSARIVEDRVEIKNQRRVPMGTKVRDDILTRDPDTLFPLQGALGYEITQTLFVGKNTLLVEGPSDILYLQALSDALKRRKKTGLDSRWTMCPSGGIDKIQPFVALFGGNELHVAVLTDQGPGDKMKIERPRRNEILKAGHVFTAAEFVGKDEADVEDFFEPEIFVEIVNRAYELSSAQALSVSKLGVADSSTLRQVKQAEAAFRLMPESIPLYDHFTPASWLIRHPELLDENSAPMAKTLERAAAAFRALNELLD